jgi:hypothetical protein
MASAAAFVRMSRIRRILVAVLLGIVAKTADAAGVSVLFVGNSLTQTNDLPAVFKRLAAASPLHVDVTVSSITPGGAFLSDHWKRGEVVPRLRDQHPNFLILQGQSTEPLSARQSFVHHTALFKSEADRVHTTTILFATWARQAGDPYYQDPSSGGSPAEMQTRLNAAYSSLAKNVGAKLAPVGVAFERAHRDAPQIQLLDGTQHPSPAGTYLAAAVLFRVVFNAPSARSGYDAGLPKPTVVLLRRIADETPLDAQ